MDKKLEFKYVEIELFHVIAIILVSEICGCEKTV